MAAQISIASDTNLDFSDTVVAIIGTPDRLRDPDILALANTPNYPAMLTSLKPGDEGAHTTTWTKQGQLFLAALPTSVSRHNSETRSWAITKQLSAAPKKGALNVILAISDPEHALAAVLAASRCFPTYSGTKDTKERSVTLLILAPNGVVTDERGHLAAAITGARFTASLVDMPPNILTPAHFVALAQETAAAMSNTAITVISGEDARDAGLGGIWGVGQASTSPPALVIIDYKPDNAQNHVAWVGKGITYDTGGLSIKPKMGMVGMKADMGGAACVLGAVSAAAAREEPHRITAFLAIAENSVATNAMRPDDIITLYSGKSVEVNNTDAEGRLVLGDAIAYANKHFSADVIIDLATLTGAQLVATGQLHAGIYANNEAIESLTVAAGRASGELTHPLPYAPEFYKGEFKSALADMKNSVKNRANAQSSCAGQFVGNHLIDFDGDWVHIDIAGPATNLKGRGTGYGVGLLLSMLAHMRAA
jgi:probable aminopeptidase NPEPL1